jgi:hypothetical protein
LGHNEIGCAGGANPSTSALCAAPIGFNAFAIRTTQQNFERFLSMKKTPSIRRAKAALALLIAATSVFAPLKAQAQATATDAALPTNQTLDWGSEAVTQTSATRGQFSLNGLWRFIPAEGDAARDPKTGWGYIRVPGNWKNNNDIVARGTGTMWQNYDGNKLAQAWYERKITIPQRLGWARVLLDLRRVSTDATVFVDGKEAGQVNWPGGTIDLTSLVRAGETHTLRCVSSQPMTARRSRITWATSRRK